MSDEPRDDQIEETPELRALDDARSALESVEREHGRIFSQLSRWRQRYEQLEEGLREDALVLSFGKHGDLENVEGPIEERLGHTAQEFVVGFESLADEATAVAVREGVRKVSAGSAHSVRIAGTFLGSNEEQQALDLIVLPVLDDDGAIVSVEVVVPDRRPVPGGGEAPNESEGFELFMEATSQRLLGDPSSDAIDESLAGLGRFFDLDRVAVNGYDDHEKMFSSLASWTRDGVEPLEVETSGISISKLPWAYALLTAGEAVVISGDAELPPDASAEKSLYMDAGVKTALLMPVAYNNSLAGFVSLQSVTEDRSWSDPEVLLARRFVATLSASLARNALAKEVDSATAEADEAKAEAEAATHQLADAKAAAEEAMGQLDEARQTADEAQSRVAAIEAEIDAARAELEEAGELSTTSQEDAASARGELDAAKAAAAEAGRELEETREQAELAQRRAEDTAADALQVRAQLEEARAEIDEARRDVDDVRAKLAEAERALAEAEPVAAPDLEVVLPDDDEEDIVVEEVAAPEPEPDEEPEEEEAEADEAVDPFSYFEPAGPADEVDPSEVETAEIPALVDEIEAVVPDPVAEVDFDAGDAEDEEADAEASDGAAFAPDTAVEVPARGFDPDATLEIEPVTLPADHDTPIEEESASGEADLPRALNLDEILQRTQDGGEPEAEAPVAEIEDTIEARFLDDDDAQEEPDAESTDEQDDADAVEGAIQLDSEPGEEVDAVIGSDLEAARQLAKQVAGKDAEGSEDGDDSPGSDEDRHEAAGEFDAVTEAVEELTGEDGALDEALLEPPEAPAESGFPGLDTVAGVSEIAGNADLYRSLLIKFRQDYKSAPEKISRAIEKGNTEIAYLLLHAIKGVAGVLGAAEVRGHAETLESALMTQDAAATQQALTLFSEALTVVIQSIDRIEAGEDLNAGPAVGGIEAHISDPKVLRTYLEGLRQHLHAKKAKQCQLVIREVTARTWPAELNEGVERLAERVRADRFEEARNEFDSLMAKLG